ncbi:chromatin assembly factor 1 subunit B [Culex quinquefasciatus]|uniref:Chromatin assembly factor 1 subunit B n=1 Tax=Culex quinquefasciatus TaxID=7176 RepID=B0WW62_CULQU|nr:chromatin assembly factor 1 subunit B [Culex quinquefasciatus]|eukprot:XP_001861634.1 chromatin assembly factor 1 subunit B [Culex quinquefasciatus]
MKCQIPEISWHNRDPVLSVDIQPKQVGSSNNSSSADKIDFRRLASGGTDSHVLIWHMTQNAECGTISLDLAADLTRHQRAVNAVRWSPNGELLASGDDESVIFIWKQKGETEVVNILDTTNEQDKETWLTMKILRGHMEDVYDLCWSPNSMFLSSGSVDNTAMVWDVTKGKSQHIFSDHKGFVQGVAWDPKNQYLATLSTDRYFRVFDLQTKKVVTRNNKCGLPVPKGHALHGKTVRLYHDDTLQTFFRRLTFSPDGNLIVTPSGVAEIEGVPKPLNTTYVYTRNSLKQPAMTLPSPDQYTVAVRFCPLYFKLRPHADDKPPVIPLPYRMIFAVATKSSVYLYDTQQKTPFALISNIHYTRLTDISWSSDGKILIVSSTDGFCSLISFNDGELGEVHELEVEIVVEKEKTPTKKATAGRKKSKDGKDDEKEKVAPTKLETVAEEKPAAQPIAFRRKPKQDDSEVKPKEVEKPAAQPIAFRRKPKEPEAEPAAAEEPKEEESRKRARSNSAENVDNPAEAKPIAIRRIALESGDAKTGIIVKEIPPIKSSDEKIVQPAKEIIIEAEKIISSEEKFESPSKKNRPVTPIAVRRHPRTPDVTPSTDGQPTAPSDGTPKTAPKKAATPIAFRRQPRTTSVAKPSPEEDDAVDTWPIDQPKPASKVVSNGSPAECDQTEDIKLVISDDDDDEVAGKDEVAKGATATTPITPRRVEFRTLSTPKSKKKLL